MKKTTLLSAAMLFMALSANAQATGYCTAANNADAQTTFDWENAQNFCPILTSDGVQEVIDQKGMKRDLRVDDTNRFLYVWDNTYTSTDASGANSFGDFGGYIDMVVGTVGWSGLGFIDNSTVD